MCQKGNADDVRAVCRTGAASIALIVDAVGRGGKVGEGGSNGDDVAAARVDTVLVAGGDVMLCSRQRRAGGRRCSARVESTPTRVG